MELFGPAKVEASGSWPAADVVDAAGVAGEVLSGGRGAAAVVASASS